MFSPMIIFDNRPATRNCGTIAAGLLFTFAIFAARPMCLRAHDSPEHQVEALTLRMARAGDSASLLIQRASEYKALGDLQKAAADLAEATRLEPKLPAAYENLSRVQFLQQKLVEASENATRALAFTADTADRGPLFLLRAQINAARGLSTEALADCELAARRDDLDWYLTRSELQMQLGKVSARLAGLKEGFERNGSIVLEIEWIEAMIDAGEYRTALDRIEQRLNKLRWRSSWLLRRARALKGLRMDFHADAQAALAELQQRISPGHPDPTLVLDRATALALLGKRTAAEKDLAAAKALGMSGLPCLRVEKLLNGENIAARLPSPSQAAPAH